ncbi:hypothetical protein AMELA_G00078400 [Ameiurus melas]|uniref:Uncharacterized protein n=1 Tax=Ameiurus melas TaxID=219545 RepID=A0A7J6B1H1_AMEME|nr:hypothetical protein AMELA_G00078400 [Ameiurus melas]
MERRYHESPWQQRQKKRAELDVLMQAYAEFEHVFKKRTELAWEKITARVNAMMGMKKPFLLPQTGLQRVWKNSRRKAHQVVVVNIRINQRRRCGQSYSRLPFHPGNVQG